MRRIPSTVIECSFCGHEEVVKGKAPSSVDVEAAIEEHQEACGGYHATARHATRTANILVRAMEELGFDMRAVDIPFADPELMKRLREE